MKASVRHMFKGFLVAVAWIGGAFALMQILPYGRTHSNPTIIKEPMWESPRTRELAVRAQR